MGALRSAADARASQPTCLDWGFAAAPLAGQTASGDIHVVRSHGAGVLVAVVDGLGHGDEAAHAAHVGAATLADHEGESVIALVRHCHKALIGTRGIAMSVVTINAADDTLTWLGIGNVEGLLLRADPTAAPSREAIVMRGGVIGYELPLLRAAMTSIAPGDVLVLATDGIQPVFVESLNVTQPPQRQAESILARYGKGTDDALVLVARYTGGQRP